MKNKRVVITGVGMVTPLGNSTSETWKNLIAGKSGIGPLTKFDPDEWKAPPNFPRIAGEVKNFDPARLTEIGIERKNIHRLDLFIKFALAAASEAIKDAEIRIEKENPWRAGLQIGTVFGGISTLEINYQSLLKEGVEKISPFFIPMLIGNMAAGQISIAFGWKGVVSANNDACATGAQAIGKGFDEIRLGRADLIVAGGTDAALTPLIVGGLYMTGALSCRNHEPEKASRPFDRKRDGFVAAEGAGMMILEELNHALCREAKIYGELIGFGRTSDAFHITSPDIEGQRECMNLALKEAGVKPEEVSYINSHGTSTQIGDINETKAIKESFGSWAYRVPISSTKSMIGHLLGAAGAVEAIFAVLAVKNGIIPPTINLDHPDSECDLDYVAKEFRKAEIQIALSNSFGFGGTNACLVFKKYN